MKKVSSFLDKFSKAAVSKINVNTTEAKMFVEKISNELKNKIVRELKKNTLDPEQQWEQEHEKAKKYLHKEKLPNGKTRYFYSEKEYQSYLKKSEYQKNEPSFMKTVKETSDFHDNRALILTEDDDMKATNEKFYTKSRTDSDYERYTLNCMLCTTTYELRRRGYDVEAKPLEEGVNGYSIKDMDRWFENPKAVTLNRGIELVPRFGDQNKSLFIGQGFDDENDVARVTKKMLKNNPPGSRGNLSVSWKGLASGHSMVYEVDSLNNIIIRDAQTDRVYTLSDLSGQVGTIEYVRTDNLELKPGITEVFNEK